MSLLIERRFWCSGCKVLRIKMLTQAENDQCSRGLLDVLCKFCGRPMSIIR